MSAEQASQRERLLDLLADQSLFGLSAAEEHELDFLRSQFPDEAENDFELTAAAIQCADVIQSGDESEGLPPSLRNMIVETARAPGMFQHSPDRSSGLDRVVASSKASERSPTQPSHKPTVSASSQEPRERTREIIAWLFAAAAMIVALLGWIDRFDSPEVIRPPVPTLAEQRQDLINSEDDIRVIPWTVADAKWVPGADQVEIGDIAWSDNAQQGFMTFRGLAENEGDDTSYQLWIFDKTRDEKFPVDGGTFKIGSVDTETIIPIDAKLAVNESVQFAITVEVEEGVVVSDRERLPLIAVVDPRQ